MMGSLKPHADVLVMFPTEDGGYVIEGHSSSEFHPLYSSRDFLCDLIANRRLTRRTTSPAGIVKNMKKTAAPPPVELSLTYIIGQNAIHAEITEIATMLRTMLGRSTELPVRVGEYALSRHHIPYVSSHICHRESLY